MFAWFFMSALYPPGIGVNAPRFRIDRVLEGPDATHLRYVRQ